MVKTWPCRGTGGCGGTYSAELTADAPAEWTEDDWAAFMDAQSEHVASHGRSDAVHIRKQIARVRTRSTTNPLTDSAAFRLSSDHNGSRTLCGAAPTDSDMDWAGGRHATNRQYVTCGRCLEMRPAS